MKNRKNGKMENLFFGKSEKMKNHGGSRRLAEARGGSAFQEIRKKSRKNDKFQKNQKNGKMEN